tara:strand:- start:1729 stop:2952 length:1224 start_codon:yes stop_codon:yes gene_type:complete
MAPWTHLFVQTDGGVGSCCQLCNNLGDLNDNTLLEIWNSDINRKMRRDMLAGKKIDECYRCYMSEDSGVESIRNQINQRFRHLMETTKETKEDGSFRYNYVYFDIRFSNLCNFKCRTCSHHLSSSFFEEAKKIEEKTGMKGTDELGLIGTFGDDKVIYPTKSKDELWNQVEEIIPSVEVFYFAGGEPLIQEEHCKIIKLLLEHKKFNATLTYSSNMSRLSYRDMNFLEVWPKFKQVEISASLDSMGKAGEYIRKGQDWKKTEENLINFNKACPKHHLTLTPVLSVMSAYRIPEMHRYLIENNFFKPDNIYIIPTHLPLAHNPRTLPLEMKHRIEEEYKKHIEWLKSIGANSWAVFESAISYIKSENQSELFPMFLNHTRMVDELRGENFFEVFPEFLRYDRKEKQLL